MLCIKPANVFEGFLVLYRINLCHAYVVAARCNSTDPYEAFHFLTFANLWQ